MPDDLPANDEMSAAFSHEVHAAARVVVPLSLWFVLTGTASTCGSAVVVSAADPTGPTLQLTVRARSSTVTIPVGASRTVTVARDEPFTVLAVVEDPQGVRTVALTGDAVTSCVFSGNLGLQKFASFDERYTSPARVGESATTGAYSVLEFEARTRGCRNGTETGTRTGWSVGLTASGANFGGGRVPTTSVTIVEAR